MRRIRCAIDRLEAEFSRRLERFDSNQGWVSEGNASTAGLLSEQCRIARSTAWEHVRQARRLSELPGTAAAFGAGEISQGHVGVNHPRRRADRLGGPSQRRAHPARSSQTAGCPAAALCDCPTPALFGPRRQPQRGKPRLRAAPPLSLRADGRDVRRRRRAGPRRRRRICRKEDVSGPT